MRIRGGLTILSASAVACCLAAACAQTTRYRVLSFFFDGVPKPGEKRAAEAKGEPSAPSSDTSGSVREETEQEDARPAPTDKILAHPPYREFRCATCHAPDSRFLVSTPQEGLCARCHDDLPGDVPYVHGPVAVKDCLFCHHHHGGQFRKVLRDEPTAICLRCHNRTDLTEGRHHADIETQACTQCHHPHGGGNRFFLKPDEN